MALTKAHCKETLLHKSGQKDIWWKLKAGIAKPEMSIASQWLYKHMHDNGGFVYEQTQE
jgi:hypothetical protein